MRTIREKESMDKVIEELTYTEACLLADEHTKDLSAEFSKLIATAYEVDKGQKEGWRKEWAAEASLNVADGKLDDFVIKLDATLRMLLVNEPNYRVSPRYQRYFRERPSALVRLPPIKQADAMATWSASLLGEAEKELQALGSTLEGVLKETHTAEQAYTTAVRERTDYRIRVIVPLIDKVNVLRQNTHATLTQRKNQHKLPKDWPARFARIMVAKSTPKEKESPPAPAT